MKYDTNINSFSFEGKNPGPTLVATGAVHGHEKCGTAAINRLKAEIEAGALALDAGRLILVPVCNPEAYAANTRLIERNLNRSLYPKPPAERKFYEDHLDDKLCAILDRADYLVDLHSYTAGGPPFIFFDQTSAKEKAFAESLGVTRNFVWGWDEAFKDANAPPRESHGTTQYARLHGAVAVTLECGQHLDPASPDIAYAAVLNVMAYLKLIGADAAARRTAGLSLPPLNPRQFCRMTTVVRNMPSTLARNFRHFEIIKAGELLAVHGNGEKAFAPADSYAIMPHPDCPIGEGMLYLGVEDEPLKKP